MAISRGSRDFGEGLGYRIVGQQSESPAPCEQRVSRPWWLPLPPSASRWLDPNPPGPVLFVANHGVGASLTQPCGGDGGRAMHLDRPVAVLNTPRVVAAGRPSDPSRSGAIRASREGGGCRLQAGEHDAGSCPVGCRRLQDYWHRNDIVFGGRTGFAIAVDAGVPIAPGRYCWGRARTLPVSMVRPWLGLLRLDRLVRLKALPSRCPFRGPVGRPGRSAAPYFPLPARLAHRGEVPPMRAASKRT